MGIDWGKVPDATHAFIHSGTFLGFRKRDGGEWLSYYESGGWTETVLPLEESYVERPCSLAQWTGEGLAPVGTVCEFIGLDSSDWHRELRNGVEVTIIAHFEGPNQRLAAFTFECTGGLQVEQGTEICFAPIRTAEQIAAEERREAIESLAGELGGHWSEEAKAPHRIMATYLHDIGYRKQVKP